MPDSDQRKSHLALSYKDARICDILWKVTFNTAPSTTLMYF